LNCHMISKGTIHTEILELHIGTAYDFFSVSDGTYMHTGVMQASILSIWVFVFLLDTINLYQDKSHPTVMTQIDIHKLSKERISQQNRKLYFKILFFCLPVTQDASLFDTIKINL
ncbi:hypothetical protein ACJX0J_038548, partial [Zea mays]